MAAATPLHPVAGPERHPTFGDGGGGPRAAQPRSRVDPTLGVLIFIASEVMLFAGLISAFLVAHASAPFWPPPDQPRLPIAATGFNTGILILSGLTMHEVVRSLRRGDRRRATLWMSVTALLGTVFLAIQGGEWTRLIRFGLTMTSSLYGGMFYLIVGAHALHLVVALIVLSFVTARLWRGRYDGDFRGVVACSAYWSFVVILWPVIYALVYLS